MADDLFPPPRKAPVAGGVLIALGAIGGTIGGLVAGQPSFGFLIGIGGGVTLAVAIWLWDRGR